MTAQSTLWDIPDTPPFSVIKDITVLREDNIPERILHRESQNEHLRRSVFGPPIWGYAGNHLWMQGTTGTGKSLCTLTWKTSLEKKLEEGNIATTKVIYINCGRKGSAGQVAYELLKNVTDSDIKNNNVLDELLTQFFKIIDEKYKFVIIILDELDRVIKKNDVLADQLIYSLVRAREMRELSNCYITLVSIVNDTKAYDKLSDGTRSSFGINVEHFPRYNAGQLYQILISRAKRGLQETSFNEEFIKDLSVYCAERAGDCRMAISLLRIAAEIAEQNKTEKLSNEQLQIAKGVYEAEMYKKEISDLSLHEQIALYGIVQLELYGKLPEGFPNIDQIYEAYRQVCERLKKEPISVRQIRNYMKNMVSLNFVEEYLLRGKMFYKSTIDKGVAGRLLKEFMIRYEIKADEIDDLLLK